MTPSARCLAAAAALALAAGAATAAELESSQTLPQVPLLPVVAVPLGQASLGGAPLARTAPASGSPALMAQAAVPSARAAAPVAALPPSAVPGARATAAVPTAAAAARPEAPAPQAAAAPDLTGPLASISHRFDGSRARPPLLERLKFWKTPADEVPGWPPKPGDTVTLQGRPYTLGPRIDGDRGNSAFVFVSGERSDLAVKIVHPQYAGIPHYAAEAGALADMARTDIPHAKLVDRSANGLVIVKRRVAGEPASDLLARGPLPRRQRQAAADLLARYLRIGYDGDFAPGNLHWLKWTSEWVVVDGGGFSPRDPAETLDAFLAGPLGRALDAVELLTALRGRLGEDSPAWAHVEAGRGRLPGLTRALEALDLLDASLPKPAALDFGPAAADPVFDDALYTEKGARQALGFDPEGTLPGIDLKHDVPEKTNTEVYLVHTPRGDKVLKRSTREIVRKELAGRALVRAFFGRMLQAPPAVGYASGQEGGLLMDHVPSIRGGGRKLSAPQRAALALAVQTFGLSDLRPANLLEALDGTGVYLIDFEMGLTRRHPNLRRLEDKEALWGMPWIRPDSRPQDFAAAIGQWRAHFLRPESQRLARELLGRAGYSARESAALLETFRANLEDLDWSLASDIEFGNLFLKERLTP